MFKKLQFVLAGCVGVGAINVGVPTFSAEQNQGAMQVELEDSGITLHILSGIEKTTKDGRVLNVFQSPNKMPNFLSVFQKYYKVEQIIISPKIQKLGKYCFSRGFFPVLKEVYFENPMQSQLEVIGSYAFSNSPVETVGEKIKTHSYTNSLRDLLKLKEIGQYAFERSSLNTFVYNGVAVDKFTIEPYAFRECTKLSYVRVHATEVSVKEKAFYNCWTLTDFDVSSSSERVLTGDRSFGNTISLERFCGSLRSSGLASLHRDTFQRGSTIRGFIDGGQLA